jgi:hypothetical protein
MEFGAVGTPECDHDRRIIEEPLLPHCWGIAKVLDVVLVFERELPSFQLDFLRLVLLIVPVQVAEFAQVLWLERSSEDCRDVIARKPREEREEGSRFGRMLTWIGCRSQRCWGTRVGCVSPG